MSGIEPTAVRLERSRETLAQAPGKRFSTSLETNGVGKAPGQAKRAELEKAAKAFEAVFLRQMIGSMRQAKLGDDLFGSQATEQFREMGDARMADDMADKGGFGIAEMLLKQFEQKAGRLNE
jgi:flagellar protein FlgJ